ncbi:transposase [Thermosulfurimonas sp. F29]|uniref:transposase n=1 Tax=Thermosulfurimonas sp. F29 TaxID=2867247 RepID=UPI001C835A3B|nr:transposase [Thermosulfurimonas sp. F29]MBX6423772.1 transposase [Thermosulfurimonas sp. F29]
MPGRPRIIAPGYPHHVVSRANHGQTCFHEEEDYRVFLDIVGNLKRKREIRIWSFCIMPNHFHLLVVPETPEDLVKFMQGLLVTYTQYYNRKYGQEGQLWRAKYHSSIVDHEHYLWKVMRYIERNPVRAGLVEWPEDYPYSSASKNRIGSQFLDEPPFTPETKAYYLEWRRQPEPPELLAFLRQNSRKNRPLGPPDFARRFGFEERKRGRPPNLKK